ncbi:hypothetical protein POL68_34425 [Stigmatella sp. ncwal1]|uniref:Lipoprotein n=1 Tax=Stigmatella ashevillensis TaxID=2995309 RepID=A0ABT5DLK6_9BACT|nr:hypothetical protein [Stigmatella ashevillena]MDC0713613.1 hypothetical protein [Stigmatella ashevillena]
MPRVLRALSFLVLAGTLCHCATASGTGGQGAPPELRFAWPEGFSAQVVSTTAETRADQPARKKTMRYRLRLEGVGAERTLVTDQMEIQETSAEPDADLEEDGGQPPSTPSLVLGPGGELRRIEGTDQVVAEMAREAEAQAIPEEQRTHILGLVRDAMEQSSRYRWEMLVGKWVGLPLKQGEGVERSSRVTLPMFGSAVDTVERVTLKEPTSCGEGAAEKRCVKLLLESSLDPTKRQKAADDLVQQVKSFMTANAGMPETSLPELTVTTLKLDTLVEYIVEPETLVPYRQQVSGKSQVVLQSPDGEAQNFDIQSERVEVFTPVGR